MKFIFLQNKNTNQTKITFIHRGFYSSFLKINMKRIYLFSLLLFFLLFIFFFTRRCPFGEIKSESFCNVMSSTNAMGAENTTNVDLSYKPQAGISISNCDKYWKEFPNESNTDFLEEIPLDRNMAYEIQPETAQKGSTLGLMDYTALAKGINDPNDALPLNLNFQKRLIDPQTGAELSQEYELKYKLQALNKKTWIHRAKEFNPTKKNRLSYDPISSPLSHVNALNNLFLKHLQEQQMAQMDRTTKILFGETSFDIYKYAITQIDYDQNYIRYTIKVVIFRESDAYTPTIFYQGIVENISEQETEPRYWITNATYIGANETSNYLMLESANLRSSGEKYQMLNDNYRHDDPERTQDVNKIVAERKEYLKQFDLKQAYACFNTDFNVYLNPTTKSNIILPYLSRQQCEAPYDFYGRVKSKGIFDKPCEKDEECPFFGKNKNYKGGEKRGKCLANGQCELPANMIPVGYHYFTPHPSQKPMCYNCEAGQWNPSSSLGTCCEEQEVSHGLIAEGVNRNKYPFLNSPDYAFEGDIQDRQNQANQSRCKIVGEKEQKYVCKTP